MNNLSDTINTPREITIGGKPVKLSALTLRDFAAFEQYCRQQLVQASIEAAAGMGKIERTALISEAIKSAAKINAMSEEAQAMMNSLGGAAYTLLLGIRRNHADVSIEWLMDNITNDELRSAMETLHELNDVKAVATDPKPQPPVEAEKPSATV